MQVGESSPEILTDASSANFRTAMFGLLSNSVRKSLMKILKGKKTYILSGRDGPLDTYIGVITPFQS